MATTAMFIEILIIGLQAVVWLALLAASIFGTKSVQLQNLSDWETLIVVLVFAIAYVLGILVDRLADTVFLRVLKVHDEFVKRCKSKEAVKKAKLNALEMAAEIFRSIKAVTRPKSKKEKRTTFSTMRLKILMQNDAVAKFFDYQRSRLRIARATVLNLLLIIISGIIFLTARTNFSALQITMFALVGVVLIALSLYAALRIEEAQTKNLEEAYDMISKKPDEKSRGGL
jgi:hypothetical protein